MGTLSPAFLSFTPQKNYPSFSGLISESVFPASYSNAGGNTLLVSDVLGGYITHTAAGAQTDTLPSAALLVPAIEGAQVGSRVTFFVKAGGAGTITIAVGAGGTANAGDTLTIATTQIKEFMVRVTALPDQYGNGAAYTLYSLGTSTF